MRKSFILYTDTLSILDTLNDAQCAELFRAIYQYQLGNDVEMSDLVKGSFHHFKMQFARDADKYAEKVEKLKKSGSFGGKKRAENAKKSKHIEANASKCLEMLANANVPKQNQAFQAVNDNDINVIYHDIKCDLPSGSSSGAESPDSPARKIEEKKPANNETPVRKYGGYRI